MRCNALVRSSVLILFAIAPILIGCDNRKSTAKADEDDSAQGSDVSAKRDPKAQTAAQDQRLETELAKPGAAAEARGWCAPETNHSGFKKSKADMLKYAQAAYAAGATKVWVVGIERMGATEIAAEMVVELPKDPAARKKVFDWESRVAGEIDQTPSTDVGQKYLDLGLD